MKQINVAYQEFKESVVRMINDSGLPMFMVSDALTLIKTTVDEIAKRELAEARKMEAVEAARTEAEKNLAGNGELQTNADENVL